MLDYDFDSEVERELQHVQHCVEQLLERLASRTDDWEADLASGVLSISLPDGRSYVLNKQRPNAQLWWSSPLSGPRRFHYDVASKRWLDVRSGQWLRGALQSEFETLFPRSDASLFVKHTE